MRIATIDVGTNTVLLLISDAGHDRSLVPLLHEQRIPRLGRGVDRSRKIQPESMERVIGVLREYRALIDAHGCDRVVVAGTSAVRDASNAREFASVVRHETGFDLEPLSGEEEALWTYRGAISGLPQIRRTTVVDIGGGSTEIAVGGPDTIDRQISMPVGAVRLTEQFLQHDPPTPAELERAINAVEDALGSAAEFPFSGSSLVAVAGTATTLALLSQGVRELDLHALAGYRLGYAVVEDLFRTLREMHSAAIRALSPVTEGREDVLTAGALILREVMAHFRFDEALVSERGLRYGLAIREIDRQDSGKRLERRPGV